MNSFKLNPNQTLYYTYHPESDKLAIRLRPELGKITSTTLSDMPHVQVSRDIRSHAVVALNISGVQQLILQQFIKSVFEQLKPYLEEADEIASEKTPTTEAQESSDDAGSSDSPNTTELATTINAQTQEAQEAQEAPEAQEAQEAQEASRDDAGSSDSASTTEVVTTIDAQAPEAQEAQEASGDDAASSDSASTTEVVTTIDAQAPETQEAQEASGDDAASSDSPSTTEVVTTIDAQAPETQEAPEASRDDAASSDSASTTEVVTTIDAEAPEAPEASGDDLSRSDSASTTEVVTTIDAEAPEAPEASGDDLSRSDSASTTEVVTTIDSEAPEVGETSGDDLSRSDSASTTEVVTTIDAQAPEASDETPKASDAEEEAQNAQEASQEVKEEGQQDKKSKRPRRRRRKKKSSQSAEATESVTESDVVQTEATSSQDESQTADQTDSLSRRKRRRKRRKKKSNTEETQNKDASEKALSATVEREIVPTLSWQERIKNDPRRSYKTNPIPGLGAPEGFAFMEMDDLIGQALYALGFLEPTPIQAKAIPPALEGRDIIGLAQTGTGKTLSFIIPILQNLLTNEGEDHIPRALIMTPTRELAVQIAEDAEFAGTHTDLLITTIYGGVGFKQQVKELKEGTDIIVATPGRLLDHMKQRTLNLDDIAILVLDEADRMLDMGFLPEIRRIMRQLPNDYQSLLFSATMPSAIERLSSDFQHQPQVIEIARQLPPETISQYLYPVEKHLKVPLLVHLLQETEEMNSVLIFTETKSEAEVVARRLERANLTVALMHGDRKQREREKALQNLRTGAVRILVATNVAARGLDINDISHVINYDMPQSVDDYIHRIGRTARGDATGQAYTFVTIADEGMVSRIESALKQELPREWAEEFNYDVPTPSWARPSVDQIIESLHKTEGLAERFNRMIRRR